MRIESGLAKERSLPANKRCRSGESRGSRTHKVGDGDSRSGRRVKCEQYVRTLCGLGKTHLATALGYAACQHGYSVLFANAVDAINTLSAAQAQGALKTQLKRYLSPALLVLD